MSEYIKAEGEVTQVLPGTKFKVRLENGKEILGSLSGKMRMNFIKIMPGDVVQLEISKYDLSKGRITYRGKPRERT